MRVIVCASILHCRRKIRWRKTHLERVLHIAHSVQRLVPVDVRVAKDMHVRAQPSQLPLQPTRAADATKLFVQQPAQEEYGNRLSAHSSVLVPSLAWQMIHRVCFASQLQNMAQTKEKRALCFLLVEKVYLSFAGSRSSRGRKCEKLTTARDES
eukprot:COSAG06_NODE_1672_length_8747_cov_27.533418_2_plen_154_part_00